MALGTLPYHGKVTAVQQLPSGDNQLTIVVLDGNLNLLSTSQIVCSAQSTDIKSVVQAIDDAIFNQMLNDAGSFSAAVLGLTDQFGE
jgi:hypothetical protein